MNKKWYKVRYVDMHTKDAVNELNRYRGNLGFCNSQINHAGEEGQVEGVKHPRASRGGTYD